MADLRHLSSAAARADEERWFPSKYSDVEKVRLWQRQTACKEFIFGPLRTADAQERKTNPVKPVPRIPYLETWIEGLVREPDVLAPKIRRMIMTLTGEGYLCWRLLERPGTYIALVHATLDDGQRHVEEDIKGVMWESLPRSLTEQFEVAQTKGELRLTHRRDLKTGALKLWDSWIVPYPTGARQLRSFGHAVIFWDEFSTHPGARQACKGIMPTLIGRTLDKGQIVRMGTVTPDTASGRYFKELYETDNLRRARAVARYGIETEAV